MRHERRPHACRQHRDSIDPRFSIADAHLTTIEVDVFDAQGQSLEQSQPRPVQQLADEQHRTMQRAQDRGHLTFRQHDRQPNRTVRPYERRTPFRRSVEHIPVQEKHRAQRLVLRRRADSPLAREHRHKGQHLTLTEPIGVLETAEPDVPPHPADVRFFGATAVVARADRSTEPIEQLRRCSRWNRGHVTIWTLRARCHSQGPKNVLTF
jgi:hypothetical protein